eukprot:5212097-Prymnesium_polylepis.1
MGANSIGDATREITGQSGPSSIADEIVCPVLNEFGPCEQDTRCRAILTSSGAKGNALLDCVAQCRERVRAAHKNTSNSSQACNPTCA